MKTFPGWKEGTLLLVVSTKQLIMSDTASSTKDPAIYDGIKWIPVITSSTMNTANNDQNEQQQQQQQRRPIPPVLLSKDDDIDPNSIFISILSHRDGEQCGKTIRSIFENAQHPAKVIIGLIEVITSTTTTTTTKMDSNGPQNTELPYCIESYCKHYHSHIIKRQQVRSNMIKLYDQKNQHDKCPYYDNIRRITYYDNDYNDNNDNQQQQQQQEQIQRQQEQNQQQSTKSKGPIFARSLVRKLLGNEQYCIQIDNSNNSNNNRIVSFINNWDSTIKNEWKKINNEFGILTTEPFSSALSLSSSSQSEEDVLTTNNVVPRQCSIKFNDNGFPDFVMDGKVRTIQEPLLTYGWSKSFSFSKCHLEETVPYDSFLYGNTNLEQFTRYVRLWTRGYDTYTPTSNIIYYTRTDDTDNDTTNANDIDVWTQQTNEQYNTKSMDRAKTLLQKPTTTNDDSITSSSSTETIQANFGIYGIGKRRTLQQLNQFLQIDIQNTKLLSTSTVPLCNNNHTNTWVPYDTSILPTSSLYTEPDNLDPQPIFPLRTRLLYYEQEVIYNADLGDVADQVFDITSNNQEQQDPDNEYHHHHYHQLIMRDPYEDMPSLVSLTILWILGLVVWYCIFVTSARRSTNRVSLTKKRNAKKTNLTIDNVTSSLLPTVVVGVTHKESNDGADKDC